MRKRPLKAIRNGTSDIPGAVRDDEILEVRQTSVTEEFIKHRGQKGIFVEGTMSDRLLNN